MRGTIQGMLAPGRDSGLVLVAADVGPQAGEDLRDLHNDRALLGCSRVREAFAHQLAPNERTARTRSAGSSGPEPKGLANVQAAAARKRTLKDSDQDQNRDLPGRGTGARLRELPVGRATAPAAGGRAVQDDDRHRQRGQPTGRPLIRPRGPVSTRWLVRLRHNGQ